MYLTELEQCPNLIVLSLLSNAVKFRDYLLKGHSQANYVSNIRAELQPKYYTLNRSYKVKDISQHTGTENERASMASDMLNIIRLLSAMTSTLLVLLTFRG
jgi:hypothetical protein